MNIRSDFTRTILKQRMEVCYILSFILCIHLGVTAFPGTGGQIFGLRNQRIYRQFNPKKEWYDFEEQNFNYEKVDSGMPWDSEMAQRMDREIDKKFSVKSLKLKKI